MCLCSPLCLSWGPSSRHCSAPAGFSPPRGGWGWSGPGSWWCTGPGQCHTPANQSESVIISQQPIRGRVYLSDAPDDRDGALETPLQQLWTEGLLFGLDMDTRGGRQQLVPAQLGQLRPPLGHRRPMLVRHDTGADLASAPARRPHPLALGDDLRGGHLWPDVRLRAQVHLGLTLPALTGLELDPLQGTDPDLAHLHTDPLHLLLPGLVAAALLALAPGPRLYSGAASRQADLEAARAPVAVVVSAGNWTRLESLDAGAVILKYVKRLPQIEILSFCFSLWLMVLFNLQKSILKP